MCKKQLTSELLQAEAKYFSSLESSCKEPKIYGITDGKAIGTYLEHKFQKYLHTKYNYIEGSSANGLDFPELMVDMKVTSIKQPQSSCPFKSGMQKIFGLGYSILVFVYDKTDDHLDKTGTLDIKHAIFIEAARTADFQMTTGLHQIIKNNGNKDDIIAFFYDRFLPIDDITANQIAENLLQAGNINIGYLTISNALQWRLQYQRVINEAGNIPGINRVF
jgi:hypothetical protein